MTLRWETARLVGKTVATDNKSNYNVATHLVNGLGSNGGPKGVEVVVKCSGRIGFPTVDAVKPSTIAGTSG